MKFGHTKPNDPMKALQETVESWLQGLMNSMAKAKAADQRVAQRLAEIRALYADLDESQLRNKIKVDWDFHDALDNYNHHCSEVERYANAVTAMAAGQSFLAKLPTV